MTFFGHRKIARTIPHVANPDGDKVKAAWRAVKAEQYRQDAFGRNADAEDMRRWEQGREQGRGGLFR